MSSALALATPADAAEIAALRNAVADDLTARHGEGWWSGHGTDRGVLFDMKHGRVYVMCERGAIVATLRLSTRKPWAIDRSHFTPCTQPLYLTAMAVAPDRQRHGLGRRCMDAVMEITRTWPEIDAIHLDAYNHPTAGAGEFYRKCGFRETGRVIYRRVPLIYFERRIER